MRAVLKYTLPTPGKSFSLGVPVSFKPLHVGLQDGYAMVWAEVDRHDLLVKDMNFFAVGTGWQVPDEAQHIGTIVDAAAGFVWHYYMKLAQ